MIKAKSFLIGFILCWISNLVIAQINTNTFQYHLKPAQDVVLITETTNALQIILTNYFNVIQEGETQITNYVWTNIVMTGGYIFGTNTNTFKILDDGKTPDKKANDWIFSGNLITPLVTDAEMLDIQLVMIGDDLTYTNDAGQLEPSTITNTVQLTYKVVPRPINDNFSKAFKVNANGGVVTGTNNYASLERKEPVHAKVSTLDASVWWNWSSPVSTNVLIDTAGSSFIPVLGVYTGFGVSNLTEVASATQDLANNLKAHVNFNAIAGTTYRIAVSGQDTNHVGNVRLRIAPGATPDKRPPQVTITSPQRSTLVTQPIISISGQAKEPLSNDSGISNVVIQINNQLTTNAMGTDSWSATLTLPPGTNIVSAFALDYAGNSGPADSIVVRYVNPTNDFYNDAILLTGVSGVVDAINGRATIEQGEPLHADNAGGHSIWYRWRAPANGTLTLNTSGSSFDTLLGLYVGTNVTNLITVASNDDAYQDSGYSQLTQTVQSNQLYSIAIDGYGGLSGSVTLQYAFVAPSPGQYYTLTVNASAGGVVSPPSATYPAGIQVTLTPTPDPNFEFASWEGDVTGPNYPLTVTISKNMIATARFRLISSSNTNSTTVATDDFESGNFKHLPWTFSSQGWQVQTNAFASRYSARAGKIADGSGSSLFLTTNMTAGAASFDLRVSSEANWDYLKFFINDVLISQWSGDVTWTNYIFSVPAGTNKLEWRYQKDASFSEGLDTAFIDNIFIPLAQPSGNGQAVLIFIWAPGNQAQITIRGQPHRKYQLEASSDMLFWFPIATLSSSTGIITFLDPESVIYKSRFYRAIVQ